MPLVRAEVSNEYGLGAAEMYREANRKEPTEILQGVAMAGLVGLLRQLGDPSDFAAQVFHGLQEESGMVSSRSRVLKSRIRRIAAALSPVEKLVLAQRNHLRFAYVPGCDWHARRDCRKHNFVYADVPEYILDSYEECPEPPRLHLLDKYDSGGPGSCFKRYSDPLFFKEASKRLQVKNRKGLDRNRSLVQREGSDCIEYNLLEANIADAHNDVQNDVPPAQRDCSSWYILWACNSGPEFVDIDFDDFEDERDIFVDAPCVIEPDQLGIDLNCMREQDAEKGSKLEVIKPNLENRALYSEYIGSANRSLVFGSGYTPILASLKSSFADFCCISARDGCESPEANSYRNWSRRNSLDWQKTALVASDFAPVSSWRNDSLLGIEQSKPPDCSLFNNLENPEKVKNLAYLGNEESSSSRTMQSKFSPSDLGTNLERTIGSVHQYNASGFAKTESGRILSGRTKDPSAPELTMPSPPLRHMKVPFQPIDGFESLTRKLKCRCGIAKDDCCTDNLPLFQLVPEEFIAWEHGGSDSDNDTSYMSSPSLLDGSLCNENSETNSEQWESPTEKGPDLCSNVKVQNHSFIEESRSDSNSSIPPVVWYNLEPNLDYAFNLNENSIRQIEANKGQDRDKKDDHFLQLIRSKSLNLRPTVMKKAAAPSNVHSTVILQKANSIRQAVGSDEAEDDGNRTNS